jgi:hypothetical protein
MIIHRCWNPAQFIASSPADPLTIYLSHHLVYYRLYSRERAIPSKHAFSSDQYMGRIDVIQVPPPHTAESIKRCIASHEFEIIDHKRVALFSSLSSQSALSNGDYIPILTGTGVGSTPREPMALVVVDTSDLSQANYSIKDGTYLIRNPEKGFLWGTAHNSIQSIDLWVDTMENAQAKSGTYYQVSLSS